MSNLNRQQFQMREIPTGLESASTSTIVSGVRRVKSGMQKVVDTPHAERFAGDDKGNASPAVVFELQRMLLTNHERELRKRGISPSHPSLGVDWSGLIKDVDKG